MPTVEDRPLAADPAPDGPEVLIEEARRRQRRRRLVTSSAVGLFGIAAVIFWSTSGDGPPANPRPTSGGGAPRSVTGASWRELTAAGSYLPPGAIVTSVTRWHGHLLTAGDLETTSRVGQAGCDGSCNPVVWVAAAGRWRVSFATRATASDVPDELVAVNGELLLFDSAQTTQLWRSSNGRAWRKVRLPDSMMAMGITEVVSNGHRVVVVLQNKFAGGRQSKYGESDPVWTSTDGIQWKKGSVPDKPSFTSLTTASDGFLASGTSRATGSGLVWRSTNGLTWSAVPVSTPPKDNNQITAGRDGAVLESVPFVATHGGGVEIRTSTGGLRWRLASVRNGVSTEFRSFGLNPVLLSTSDGFLAVGETNARIERSTNGRNWTRLAAKDRPPANLQPEGYAVDGTSRLLVIEDATKAGHGIPAGATTIWQLNLR
jgi:hypothetical protein